MWTEMFPNPAQPEKTVDYYMMWGPEAQHVSWCDTPLNSVPTLSNSNGLLTPNVHFKGFGLITTACERGSTMKYWKAAYAMWHVSDTVPCGSQLHENPLWSPSDFLHTEKTSLPTDAQDSQPGTQPGNVISTLFTDLFNTRRLKLFTTTVTTQL